VDSCPTEAAAVRGQVSGGLRADRTDMANFLGSSFEIAVASRMA
jgi:hypothetical protein